MSSLTAYLLFFIVLFFIIKKPFNIGIGWTATVGTILALILGVVSIKDVYKVVEIVFSIFGSHFYINHS